MLDSAQTLHSNEFQNEAVNAPTLEVSKLPLDKYLLNLSKESSERQKEETRRAVNNIVTLVRKFRGSSPADNFGYMLNDTWVSSSAYNDLVSTNQFQARVKGAVSNFLAANIKLNCSAVNSSAQSRSIEKIAQGLYRVLAERDWDEQAMETAVYGGILQLNYVVESRFNKDAGGEKLRLPVFAENTLTISGRFVCANPECSTDGLTNEIEETYECPRCAAPVQIISEPETESVEVASGYDEMSAGETETEISGGWCWEVDSRNAKSSDFSKADWVKKRSLVSKNELKELYPHLKLEAQGEISYALRWARAIERGEDSPFYSQGKDDDYEFEKVWFKKEYVSSYVAPVDFKLGDFEIKRGERLAEVCPDGVVFGVCGNQLCFVDNENKNECLTAGAWQNDPCAWRGLGVLSAVAIQKKINRLENILWEGVTRSIYGSIVYNPEALEGAKLEGSNRNIPLKKGFAQTQRIEHYCTQLRINGYNAEITQYLQLQYELMKEILGVPDIAVGFSDSSNKTFGGQALAQNKALGLLLPATKSLARAMEKWLRHQLKLIQKFYSTERILSIGTRFGERWETEDAEAFKTADLDRTLFIEYADGSEIPQTRAEKEAKIFALYGAGVFRQGNPNNPQVLKQIVDLAGVDVDVDFSGYESNDRLANRRYELLEELGAGSELDNEVFAQSQMMEGGEEAAAAMIGGMLNHPAFLITAEAENHSQMVDFWSQRIRNETASKNPSLVKIEAMRRIIGQHTEARGMNQMQANALATVAQAPQAVGAKVLDGEIPLSE